MELISNPLEKTFSLQTDKNVLEVTAGPEEGTMLIVSVYDVNDVKPLASVKMTPQQVIETVKGALFSAPFD